MTNQGSERLALIKEKILDPAISSGDFVSVEHAATIWKAVVEAEKLEEEIRDRNSYEKKRSESARFWIPVLAPTISAAALIATVIFQVHQFRVTSEMNIRASEDSAWREVLNKAKNIRGPEGAFALTLMKGFLDSPRYGKAAREISVNLLGHMADIDAFKVLFPDLMRRTDWSNLGDIIGINASINRAYQDTPDSPDGKQTGAELMRGDLPPSLLNENFSAELHVVTDALASFMRSNRELKPPDLILNLNDVQFATANLDGVDLSKSILGNANFYNCTVTGAVFGDIADFDGSHWERTPWWKAKKVDLKLLGYLRHNFPFNEGVDYAGPPLIRVDYDKSLKRLMGNP